MIVVNMTKAREIHKDRIRGARAPLFEKLDVEFQRQIEVNGDTSQIAAQKQILRDLTKDPAIAAAQTPEELKAAWPSILGE